MTLISLEDAKAEVRKAVSDFKTRYDINYRLNSLPSIELEDEPNSSEKPNNCDTCKYGEDKHRYAHICNECGVGINNYEPKTEPQYSEDDMYWLSLAEDVVNGKMSDAEANQAWLEYINHKDEPTIFKMEQVDETQTETQTETQNSNLTFEKDECAKEYEELGLKELKELIEADRKTEPQTDCAWK